MKQKLTILLLAFSLIAVPFFASARGLVPCGGYTDSGERERPWNVEDIFVLIARTTNWLIAVAGVYAVYKLIFSGWNLIVSMGNEESITKNKGAISNAIVGLVLVLMAYMFINTIVNFMLTRDLAIKDARCRFDLGNPLNYLQIDPNKCSGLDDSKLHQ